MVDPSSSARGAMVSVDMTFTSVRGHMMELDFPEEYKWGKCDPLRLFSAPIKTSIASVRAHRKVLCLPPQDALKVAQNLSSEARRSDILMIWTDCDLEGEHIGYEVAQHCRRERPGLLVKRARFSALIASQIKQACQAPVDLDLRAAAAVEARQHIDLRAGAAFTRLQTMGLKAGIRELEGLLISYGPCQFPTLGFVVDHYKRVQEFVPERFWYIDVTHKVGGGGRSGGTVQFLWDRKHLFDEQIVRALHAKCAASNEAVVLSTTQKPTKKRKPSPLTTVELQKSASRLFSISPKRVLDVAEGLYQRGLLSYPRTETDQYDKNFDFASLLEKQRNDGAWGEFAAQLADSAAGGGSGHTFERPRNGSKNDQAHPPIHPSSHANGLSGDEKKVYDYVTRRFLASCSTDALGDETTVAIELGGERFHATGLMVRALNYLEVFVYEKWSDKWMPQYTAQQRFRPSSCEVKQGSTTRPNLLTEADLVNLMDKNGIGTDATIAEHIKKVIDRQYVMTQKQGKTTYLLPSTLGMGLVEGYDQMKFDKSLCKPLLRRETEQKLHRIASGAVTKERTIEESIEEYRAVYATVQQRFALLTQNVGKFLRGEPLEAVPSVEAASAADSEPAPRRTGAAPSAAGAQPASRRSGAAPSSPGGRPSCHCGTPAQRRTDGSRSYWTCARDDGDDNSCGFFLWCANAPPRGRKHPRDDDPPDSGPGGASRDGPPRSFQRLDTNRMEAGRPQMCSCDLRAKLCHVRQGDNAGRAFYVCPKESKRARCVAKPANSANRQMRLFCVGFRIWVGATSVAAPRGARPAADAQHAEDVGPASHTAHVQGQEQGCVLSMPTGGPLGQRLVRVEAPASRMRS